MNNLIYILHCSTSKPYYMYTYETSVVQAIQNAFSENIRAVSFNFKCFVDNIAFSEKRKGLT